MRDREQECKLEQERLANALALAERENEHLKELIEQQGAKLAKLEAELIELRALIVPPAPSPDDELTESAEP